MGATTADAKRIGLCGAMSKPLVKRKPGSYQLCTSEDGHEQAAHTSCDGHGHVIARWKSETSLVEVWLPDGSWCLV